MAYGQIQPPATAKDQAAAVSMRQHVGQAEEALREGTRGSMALHALEQAERGLGFGVDRPRKWKLMRGEAHLKLGNPNAIGEAHNMAMSLLRTNHHDPEALVLRGRALYAQGENEKAIQHFRQALNCDPDFQMAVKYLKMVQKLDKMKEDGNLAYKSNRFQDAVRIYTQALEIDPSNKGTNSKLLQNRALGYIKVGRQMGTDQRSLRKADSGGGIDSYKSSNWQLPTASELCNLIPATSRRARQWPGLLANGASGKRRCGSTRRSQRRTHPNRGSEVTSATRRRR